MAWDKTQPQVTDAVNTGPSDFQTNNAAIEAAIDQDHDFSTGGTQTGKHNKVSLIEAADIGTGAEGLPILGAQTAGGKAELVFTDEDDNDVQITENGKIKSASLDMKDEDNMASNSATHAASQQSIKAYVDSGTVTMTNKTLTAPALTSPVINTGVSGTAVLDEDNMASNSDTKLATQQSIKAYADGRPAAAMTPSTYAGEESVTFANGLILKQGTESVAAYATDDVTYGAAFPNAVVSISATYDKSVGSSYNEAPAARTKSGAALTTLQVHNPTSETKQIFWQVWGY